MAAVVELSTQYVEVITSGSNPQVKLSDQYLEVIGDVLPPGPKGRLQAMSSARARPTGGPVNIPAQGRVAARTSARAYFTTFPVVAYLGGRLSAASRGRGSPQPPSPVLTPRVFVMA